MSLFPKDIDLESGSIRILNGKGGRARTVGIDPAAGNVVACLLAVPAQLGLGDPDDGPHAASSVSSSGTAPVRV